MAEPEDIVGAVEAILRRSRSLTGRRALVTSGPTHEPIDPVRYLTNRSSGKQGHAIAAALAAAGADTILVSGPTAMADPPGVRVVHVESAVEMLAACLAALPVDVAVCAAAVADWRVADPAVAKLKKGEGPPPSLRLEENPDILAALAQRPNQRPVLVVGFAAETEGVLANARAKLERKGCDWVVANEVGAELGVFGGEYNTVHLVTAGGCESWPTLTKRQVAEGLVDRIADWMVK
jgi:phosphopantothenoylcysteine decarboxylase/phosphopantothenate--cysteine ligase